MALTTALDLATLGSWNLLTDYGTNKAVFIAVGKAIYQAITTYNQGSPIGLVDLERPLAAALRVNNIFKTICASKWHANPSLHAVFALALARYIIDYEWQNITSP